jgi:dihydrodipicolinate synthase/N-acetylneuraminate lyase
VSWAWAAVISCHHFDADGVFQEGAYRAHCSWMLAHELSGLFAAGGTGEILFADSR